MVLCLLVRLRLKYVRVRFVVGAVAVLFEGVAFEGDLAVFEELFLPVFFLFSHSRLMLLSCNQPGHGLEGVAAGQYAGQDVGWREPLAKAHPEGAAG
jgi:hypothetical protein